MNSQRPAPKAGDSTNWPTPAYTKLYTVIAKKCYNFKLAQGAGIEPATFWLTARRSTAELPLNGWQGRIQTFIVLINSEVQCHLYDLPILGEFQLLRLGSLSLPTKVMVTHWDPFKAFFPKRRIKRRRMLIMSHQMVPGEDIATSSLPLQGSAWTISANPAYQNKLVFLQYRCNVLLMLH